MKREEFQQLAEKILNGNASDEELELYIIWFNNTQDSVAEINDADFKKATVYKKITDKIYSPKRKLKWLLRAAAVTTLFISVAGTAYYLFHHGNNNSDNAFVKNDVQPGGNKAILTLSTGKRVVLDDSSLGQIAADQGVFIKKNKSGQVVYDFSNSVINQDIAYQPNIITTPKGGQYEIVLTDGTTVWLNAASSIKFPSAFTGKTREVEITGEAYFEVAKDKSHPFHVKANKQEITVLGTHFDVNSYADEKAVTTTLFEGSVQISDGQLTAMLKPGQQSLILNDEAPAKINVDYIKDTDEVMAWKNGLFVFNDTEIPVLMRQISRWYDVDIVYEGKIPDDKFSGAVSRSVNLSKVLKLLQYTGINYRIEGRQLIIK